jgi:hypothetical protein
MFRSLKYPKARSSSRGIIDAERLRSSLSEATSTARKDQLLIAARRTAQVARFLGFPRSAGPSGTASHHAHFNPDQPRVPPGRPDGGQWTSAGGHVVPVAAEPSDAPGDLILSDTTLDGIRIWTQYADARSSRAVEDETTGQGTPNSDDLALIEHNTQILHRLLIEVSGTVIRHPGTSPASLGVATHFAFASALRILNLPGIGKIDVEQSFDKDGEAKYGADGSIRTDVVLRNHEDEIIAIYDLKTGNATVRPSRAAELRAMTKAGPHVPVIELRAAKGPAYR